MPCGGCSSSLRLGSYEREGAGVEVRIQQSHAKGKTKTGRASAAGVLSSQSFSSIKPGQTRQIWPSWLESNAEGTHVSPLRGLAM